MSKLRTFARILVAAAWLSIGASAPAHAHHESIDEHEAIGWFTIYAADALVARPLLLATAVVGGGIWLVSLPFTALSGDVSGLDVLVAKPAAAAFTRCLGCSFQD